MRTADRAPANTQKAQAQMPGRPIAAACLLVAATYLLINVLFIPADEIDGPTRLEKVTTQTGIAMEPTILNGQPIRVVHGGSHDRFDIVVYLAPDLRDAWYVGRIVGLPGEVIEIRDGAVYIDGVILDEPHAHSPQTASNVGPGRIPMDGYFILGDNRNHSRDSSVFGPVAIDNVAGKVTRLRPRTAPSRSH
jgi:signal peptidase I